MSISSRAVVFTGPKQVEIRKIKLPELADGDVLVRTLFSGISAGTELWQLTARYFCTKFPIVPGYQKIGVVERVGGKVTNYKAGDRVYLRFTKTEPEDRIEWGGHTELSVIPADEPELFKVPAALDAAQGSLLCIGAVGYHGAAEVMPVAAGEWVIVIGLGMIGQFSAQTAALRGAKVIGVDLLDGRLKLAAELAGAITVNPSKPDIVAVLKQHCPKGADAAIDTTAHVETINDSFKWLRQGGRYCFQAYYPDRTSIDLLEPHIKELVMYNPTNCTVAGEKFSAEAIASGKLRMKELITHVVKADKAPGAYEMLLNRRQEAMGVAIDWQ